MGGPPIVADGIVYASRSDGYGYVYAVDATSGALRWRFQWHDAGPPPIDLWGPRTIAHRRNTIYVGVRSSSTGPSGLCALDAGSGEVRWRIALDDGPAMDVAADDDKVIAGCGADLRCFDARDGAQRWRYTIAELPGARWFTPVLHDDAAMAVAILAQAYPVQETVLVVAVDEHDGAERWVMRTEERQIRIAAADRVLYLTTRYGNLAALHTDSGDQLLSGDDPWGGAFEQRATRTRAVVTAHPGRGLPRPVLVSHTPVSAALSTPVITTDSVYVGSENGYVYQVNRASGGWRWRWDTDVQAKAVAHADGRVHPGFADGSVAGYPDQGGELLWHTRAPTGSISGLTAVDGVLYVSGDPYLAAFDATTGAGPWRWPRQKTVRRAPDEERSDH